MHMHLHEHSDHPIDEADKAICPVMHIPVSKQEAVSKGLVREYEGKTYYLCSRTVRACSIRIQCNMRARHNG